MILILSEESDLSTTQVQAWLNFYNEKYTRINDNDIVNFRFIGDDFIIKSNNDVWYSKIKSYWYRRGQFKINGFIDNQFLGIDNLRINEMNKIFEFISFKLNLKKNINTLDKSDVNKLVVNYYANQVGLNTPNDLLYNNKEDILELNDSNYITKVISGSSIQEIDDYFIFNYTKKLNVEKIGTTNFFPSLVQNYIEKKYELRIFYLNGEFYSMAIFSQKDDQTIIDFRNYNKTKPNRTVPFKIPDCQAIKLDLLMKKLEINCGSIDMIVTSDNEYFFLEVNPVGQFGMVSYPCNYNLEKKIAQYLAHE